MMAKNAAYKWDNDLKDAKKDRFKTLKKHAEDSVILNI